MPTIKIYPNNTQDEWMEKGSCQLCGESYDMMSTLDSKLCGEYWIKDDDRFADSKPDSILAHPDCAANLQLKMA